MTCCTNGKKGTTEPRGRGVGKVYMTIEIIQTEDMLPIVEFLANKSLPAKNTCGM
jgi:hypothetical protein